MLDAVVMDDGVRRIALMLRGRALAPSHAPLARDVFDAAVRSVRPGPGAPPVPPLVPSEAAGTLDGAFTGLRFDRRPNGEGETEILVKAWILLFDPSGLFSRVVPSAEGGVLAHCRTKPEDCGTYSLLGGNWLRRPDRIRLREGSGRYGLIETRELPFVRQEETLQIDGTRLNPAANQPPGTLLEGLWSMLSVLSETAVRRALTLGRDGRFQRSVEENDFGGDISLSSSAGRYRLEGYRLLLESDDGQRESLGVLQPDRDSDGLLFIEGDAYLKRASDQRIVE